MICIAHIGIQIKVKRNYLELQYRRLCRIVFFKNGHIFFQDDVYSHLYTLIVKPDNTYEVKIDNEKAESGELEADWDFLPAKKIKVGDTFFSRLTQV